MSENFRHLKRAWESNVGKPPPYGVPTFPTFPTSRISMPPFEIDGQELFAAIVRLANESDRSWRFTKKGDKRPACDVETQQATRRRNLKAKQAAAADRILAEASKRNSTARPPGEDIASRMLRVMEPGKWYGMGDVARLAGIDRTGRGKVHQVLLRRKWVEQARNPGWSAQIPNPWEIHSGAEPQPKNLYRLTEAGLQVRNRLAKTVKPV